jgi:hypothetical protein
MLDPHRLDPPVNDSEEIDRKPDQLLPEDSLTGIIVYLSYPRGLNVLEGRQVRPDASNL